MNRFRREIACCCTTEGRVLTLHKPEYSERFKGDKLAYESFEVSMVFGMERRLVACIYRSSTYAEGPFHASMKGLRYLRNVMPIKRGTGNELYDLGPHVDLEAIMVSVCRTVDQGFANRNMNTTELLQLA